jgi:hypothetical protein
MVNKRQRVKHTVSANMQVLELTKSGSSIKFEIFADEEKLGTMVIGRGSITWYGRNRKRGKRLSWSQFAETFDDYA